MRISDWSSDVCSSDLRMAAGAAAGDDVAGMAARRQAVAQGVESCQALVRRAPALGEVQDVLHLTGVAMPAIEDEPRTVGDDPGGGEHASSPYDPGTIMAALSETERHSVTAKGYNTRETKD